MKIKILLAGNNASRANFLNSLYRYVIFTQDGPSLNVAGTGTYKFRLGEDDIEILYIEDHPKLKSNYKNYAVDAHAIIFVDADQDTIKQLRAVMPKCPQAIHEGGGEINSMAGINAIVKSLHAKKKAPSATPGSQFYKSKQPAVKTGNESINFELMKKFIDATPKRIIK